jgi:hypothetical protein
MPPSIALCSAQGSIPSHRAVLLAPELRDRAADVGLEPAHRDRSMLGAVAGPADSELTLTSLIIRHKCWRIARIPRRPSDPPSTHRNWISAKAAPPTTVERIAISLITYFFLVQRCFPAGNGVALAESQ